MDKNYRERQKGAWDAKKNKQKSVAKKIFDKNSGGGAKWYRGGKKWAPLGGTQDQRYTTVS